MRVEVTSRAAKEIDSLPNVIHARVHDILARLRDWPTVSGAKPLHGKLAGHYRIRAGDYRVQFYLKGQMLMVEKVGHRDGFYED